MGPQHPCGFTNGMMLKAFRDHLLYQRWFVARSKASLKSQERLHDLVIIRNGSRKYSQKLDGISLLTRRLLSFENCQSHCWSIQLFSIRNHFLLLGINCATNGRPGSWARHFPSLCNPKLTATLSVQRRWMPASGRRLYIVTIYLNGASNSAVYHTRPFFLYHAMSSVCLKRVWKQTNEVWQISAHFLSIFNC